MKIGIIGAGMIGGTLGQLWAKAGHEIYFGTRNPGRVKVGERQKAGSSSEAANFGDVVMLAIPFGETENVAKQIAPFVAEKVLLDSGNPYEHREAAVAEAVKKSGRGSGRWVASHFPAARVVKAFNTVYFKNLLSYSCKDGTGLGIPVAGDDPSAVETAKQLIRDAGFEPVFAGRLDSVLRFDPGTPLWNTTASGADWKKYFETLTTEH